MGTIGQKVAYLEETKNQIKNAIIEKGVQVNDEDTFRSYAGKIGEIQSGGSSNAKITNASYLFYGGVRLDHMNELLALCDNVDDLSYMCYQCRNLTEVDLNDFFATKCKNVKTTKYMFTQNSKLTSLDLSNLDNSNNENMEAMISNCTNLSNLVFGKNFNTEKVKSFRNFLNNCYNISNLDVSSFNTSNATDFYNAFYKINVTDLDLSSFDMSKATSIEYILNGCSNLTNLKSFKNLGKGYVKKTTNYYYYKLQLSNSPKLTHESLMDVINNLYDLNLTYDVANGGTLYTQQLVLGATNLAKLSAEEIAIATNKGWTVS